MQTSDASAARNAASRRLARRVVKVVGCTLALLVILPIAAVAIDMLVLDPRDGRKFERIRMNASRQEVESVMGAPSDWNVCGRSLWWAGKYLGENDGRCVTETRYEHFLSTWSIGYSADGRVVHKFHAVSD